MPAVNKSHRSTPRRSGRKQKHTSTTTAIETQVHQEQQIRSSFQFVKEDVEVEMNSSCQLFESGEQQSLQRQFVHIKQNSNFYCCSSMTVSKEIQISLEEQSSVNYNSRRRTINTINQSQINRKTASGQKEYSGGKYVPKLVLQEVQYTDGQKNSAGREDWQNNHHHYGKNIQEYQGYSDNKSAEQASKTLDTQAKSNDIQHFSGNSSKRAAQLNHLQPMKSMKDKLSSRTFQEGPFDYHQLRKGASNQMQNEFFKEIKFDGSKESKTPTDTLQCNSIYNNQESQDLRTIRKEQTTSNPCNLSLDNQSPKKVQLVYQKKNTGSNHQTTSEPISPRFIQPMPKSARLQNTNEKEKESDQMIGDRQPISARNFKAGKEGQDGDELEAL